ncbi:MAG: disulfide isomerase DsbC N-terminal domain-containing protein [Brevinematia bacterium]
MLISCAGTYSINRFNVNEVKDSFQSIFKNTKIVEVKESEIPGVYEIYYAGENSGMIYYFPEKGILIIGEFLTTNGTFITSEKLMKFTERYSESEKGESYDSQKRTH